MKKLLFLLVLGLMSNTMLLRAQEIINPVSATTTLTAEFGSSLDNTINGEGLDMFPTLSGTHEATNPLNSFLATNEVGSIDFDLGGNFLVEGLAFWNQNAPGPGQTGIQDVVISSSDDGVTFTPITGAPSSFAQVLSPTSAAQQFAFPQITASFIRVDVISNYGDPGNLVAFAEIAFSGTEVILGINDNDFSNAISLFPNPATDVVTIHNNSVVAFEGIAIYDMNGRLVQNINITKNRMDHRVDISKLSSGMYMVNIYGNNDNVIKRIIKN